MGHLCECINIFRETFASVAELTIRTGNIGVCVVDVPRKEYAGMNCTPIGTHFLTVFTTSVKVGHFVCSKHIVHIFREFCLKRGHNGKLLTYENLC